MERVLAAHVGLVISRCSVWLWRIVATTLPAGIIICRQYQFNDIAITVFFSGEEFCSKYYAFYFILLILKGKHCATYIVYHFILM